MSGHSPTTHLLERLSRLIQNEAHASGLKPVQWEILRFLRLANRFSRTPSAVTAYLNLTKGTVSQSLNALETKQLVTKEPVAGDRRRLTLALTAAGREMLAGDPMDALDAAVRSVEAARGEDLSGGLRAVLSDLLRRRGGRAFGVCRTCRHYRPEPGAAGQARCALLNEALTPADSEAICVEHDG